MLGNSSSTNSSASSVNNAYSSINQEQMLSDAAYLICGIYLTILGVVAFVGNITVLLVLTIGRPNFMKIHSVMLFSVSFSDLVVGCTAYPLTAISSYNRRWVFSETVCVASGFIVYFFTMCNINSLCVIAFCRYVIVCQPQLEPYIRGKYIKYNMMFVWLYALFWTGVPLIGWSSYTQESFGTSCTLDWDGRTFSDLSYNLLCIVFCYLLPVGVFLFSYYNVARSSLLSARTAYGGHLPMRDNVLSPADQVMEEINRKIKIRASRHMTMISLVMITSFVVTWSPYAILTFFNIISEPVAPEVQLLPTMFAKLSCVVNPIIYCGLSDRFRDAAVRIFSLSNRIQPLSSVRRIAPRAQQNASQDITVMGLADISTNASRQPSDQGHDKNYQTTLQDTSDSCQNDGERITANAHHGSTSSIL